MSILDEALTNLAETLRKKPPPTKPREEPTSYPEFFNSDLK